MKEKDWSHYQSGTLNDEVATLLKDFMDNYSDYNNVVELGCGAGNETVYMIKKGYNVVAIDRQLNPNFILDRLTEEEKNRVTFIEKDFSELEIPKCDCLTAFFSIPFCKQDYFNNLWNNIYESLNDNGYFVGQLFGDRDAWNVVDWVNTFSKEQVLKYLDKYEVLKFEEVEYIRESDNKKWHYFDIIAKKK